MGCLGMLNTRAPSDIVCFLSSAPYNWLWTRRPFLCKDGLWTRLFPTAGWHRSWEVNFCLPRPQACLWWDMAWKPGVLTAPDRVACCQSLISSGLLTPSEKDLHRLSAKGIYTHKDARCSTGTEWVRGLVTYLEKDFREKALSGKWDSVGTDGLTCPLASSDRDIISYKFSHSITQITINI